MNNDNNSLQITSEKAEQEQSEITKDKLEKLSDEELDKVAGGSACAPRCVKRDNKCWC